VTEILGEKVESLKKPETLGELKQSGYRPRSVKDEIRENLMERIRTGDTVFPGIVGFDQTVIPQVEHALLAKHNFILLGLRGQAKTRIIRLLLSLLDEAVPAVKGCPIHSDPLQPLSAHARRVIREQGDDAEIEWLASEERFNEKLATPDVSVADLIGDIDPIKAMSQSRSLADEEIMHFGIIPRSNRGIFAINELPDLQPRIQVSLLNIMEENDIQIRGFPIRIPLDLLMVFTANPEDYTNRGNIITPLKDRIGSQILTHYPETIEDAIAIMKQEAWMDRVDGRLIVPDYVERIVAQVAVEARNSEYVDQNSGVSARATIALYETLHSAIERRLIKSGEKTGVARMCDLYSSAPALSGKVELVYKGEQEGLATVSNYLVGKGIKEIFNVLCTNGYKAGSDRKIRPEPFQEIIAWFEAGNSLELTETTPNKDFLKQLKQVPGLERKAREKLAPKDDLHLATAMEFVLEGLALHYLISKKVRKEGVRYVDSLEDMMRSEAAGDGTYM
jgi:magnesium chelatase subunit I